MPRAEVGTPKWLANKMRSKGLQRLRWYCQMCEKQCRDENGFKCHINSEAHQRQMKVFVQRPGKFMDEFSRQFEQSFMQLMRTKYCRTRVLANSVYCEVIADKEHIHMNSTVWTTLSEFVLYLARTGQCKADQTARGWYLEYIDVEKIRREKELRKGLMAAVEGEYLDEQRIERAARELKAVEEEMRAQEEETGKDILLNNVKKGPIVLEIQKPNLDDFDLMDDSRVQIEDSKKSINVFDQFKTEPNRKRQRQEISLNQSKKKDLSALDSLILEHESMKKRKGLPSASTDDLPPSLSSPKGGISKRRISDSGDTGNNKNKNDENEKLISEDVINSEIKKESSVEDSSSVENENLLLNSSASESFGFPKHPQETSDIWISKELIVEVYNSELADGIYHQKKGQIVKIFPDSSTCHVRMYPPAGEQKGKLLKLDSQFLNTVIPSPPKGWARVVMGPWRGHEGRVVRVITPTSPEEETEDESSTEGVNMLLSFGPYWGDRPDDLLNIFGDSSSVQKKSEFEDYDKKLKIQKNVSHLYSRGELLVTSLPLDFVCKVPEPDEYATE